jgi:hypothetical protein
MTSVRGTLPLRDAYYIFVPVAEFTVGGLHFCKSDRRYSIVPEVGQHLFLPGNRSFIRDAYLEIVDETGYLAVAANGNVELPRSMHNSAGGAATADDVRRMARAGGQARQSQ